MPSRSAATIVLRDLILPSRIFSVAVEESETNMHDVYTNRFSISALYRILMSLTLVRPDSGIVESGDPEMLSRLLESELSVVMTPLEIVQCKSFESIAEVVHNRLKLDFEGNSIPDLFTKLE
jgi:hypothetical protein